MLRRTLFLAVLAAFVAAPAVSSASVLSRRLTIRYPGQDAPKHRHHVGHDHRRHVRREDPHEGRWGDHRAGRWDR